MFILSSKSNTPGEFLVTSERLLLNFDDNLFKGEKEGIIADS